ncbi:hypothetical protein [Mesorhizobium ciceri]|uniref:hypothetical protein n=1 Tax=Mesorhizobium TaxID=68287 RepID=UPI000478D129|nr:hypothetical protein [Mesorhizobium ciceri]
MPNHVLTEIRFKNIDADQQGAILAIIRGPERPIDFATLLPIPSNIWQGSVSTKHSVFPGNALDWSRANWGTKWNAYGIDQGGKYQTIAAADDTLTLTFQTAWQTPYGWLLALWHIGELPFEYSWFDEGRGGATIGRFTAYSDEFHSNPWSEEDAPEAEYRRMHKLMWGVEEFEDEDA